MNRKRKLFYLIPYVAVALLVVYLSYHLVNSFTPQGELYLVKNGTITENITAQGYIFRDEYTVTTQNKNGLNIMYENGEKVPANATVATVYDSENGKTVNIIGEKSGYFYTECDGLENIFSSETALSLTTQNFDSVIGTTPEATEKSIGKIAYDFCWYFACKTASNKGFKVGQKYKFKIEETSVTMELVKLEGDTKYSVAVFKCSDIPQNFSFARICQAEITVAEYSGAIIPQDAVKSIKKFKYVYIFKDGHAHEHSVNISFEKDGLCVAEGDFELIGKLIIIGKNLYDGKVIK